MKGERPNPDPERFRRMKPKREKYRGCENQTTDGKPDRCGNRARFEDRQVAADRFVCVVHARKRVASTKGAK